MRYWRSAALGGNVAAMRHYAVGNAFRMNDTLDNLDALRVYRSEAEAIAQRAVAAGDLITAMTLANAYSRTGGGIVATCSPNPYSRMRAARSRSTCTCSSAPRPAPRYRSRCRGG